MAKSASLLNTLKKNKEFIFIVLGVALLLFIVVRCINKNVYNILSMNKEVDKEDEEEEEEDDEDDEEEDDDDDDLAINKLLPGPKGIPEAPVKEVPVNEVPLVGAPAEENVEMASNGAAATGDSVVEGYYS